MTGLGILAEDQTDCDALKVLIRRIRPGGFGDRYAIKTRYTNGCTNMRRKGTARLREMADAGCDAMVIVHDLDRNPSNGMLNDHAKLLSLLQKKIVVPAGTRSCICIPIEELEAWFWCDQSTLDRITRTKGMATALKQPNTLKKPKEALMDASRRANRKPIYTTNKNAWLAETLDLAKCAQCCPGFQHLSNFIQSL